MKMIVVPAAVLGFVSCWGCFRHNRKEIHMKMIVVPAAVLLFGLGHVVLAQPLGDERGKELAALEKKMLGAWKGQAGCVGNFLFRADGTYELKGHGPAGDEFAGTWKVRWDALPATLLLTCKTSEIPEEIGRTAAVKLIRLDNESLAIQRANQPVEHFARVKK